MMSPLAWFATQTPKAQRLGGVAILVVIGLIIYSNSFSASFHLDDKGSIVDMEALRNLSTFWHQYYPSHWVKPRVFGYFTFALNYQVHQLDVFGYHLVNLVIHLLNTLLVWQLVVLLLATPRLRAQPYFRHRQILGFLAGLFFLVHPLQTQAVTYIVQRFASLATFFYLCTLCGLIKAFNHWQTHPRWTKALGFYGIGSLLTFVLGIFTKEIVFSLPLTAGIFYLSFLKTKITRLSPAMTALLLGTMGTLILVATLSTNIPAWLTYQQTSNLGETVTYQTYAATQPKIVLKYLQLVFLPLNQQAYYYYPISTHLDEDYQWLSLLVLLSILAVSIYCFKRFPAVSFAVWWFFITLLPESSLIPLKDLIFEHRLYLPMVGISFGLVLLVFHLAKFSIRRVVFVIAIWCLVLGALTYQRNTVWATDETLWRSIIAHYPDRWQPYDVLGFIYARNQQWPEAFEYFNQALTKNADNQGQAVILHNIGSVYLKLSYPQKAIDFYQQSIARDPSYAEPHRNLGIWYQQQKQPQLSQKHLQQALYLAKTPEEVVEMKNQLGVLFLEQQKYTEAKPWFESAIASAPHEAYTANAYTNLGYLLIEEGQLDLAIETLQQALRLNPQSTQVYGNLMVALSRVKAKSPQTEQSPLPAFPK